jgi:hypothetical protein
MENLDGYKKIYSIVSQFIDLMKSIPQFMIILENELEEYLNKKKSNLNEN